MSVLYSILLNLAFVCFGYLFIGSLNTSIILSKLWMHDDVRNYHSKNAGATNSLRTYGKSFALAVFFIDFLKTAISVFILAAMLNHIEGFKNFASKYFISPQSLGLGIIIGHIYPIYFKFKGGKGVACSVGLAATINIVFFFVAAVIFFIIAAASRYVSLASVLTAAIMIPLALIPWMTQGILGWWPNFVVKDLTDNYWYVTGILYSIDALLVIIAHHTNITRLIHHDEAKINLKKWKEQSAAHKTKLQEDSQIIVHDDVKL